MWRASRPIRRHLSLLNGARLHIHLLAGELLHLDAIRLVDECLDSVQFGRAARRDPHVRHLWRRVLTRMLQDRARQGAIAVLVMR